MNVMKRTVIDLMTQNLVNEGWGRIAAAIASTATFNQFMADVEAEFEQ